MCIEGAPGGDSPLHKTARYRPHSNEVNEPIDCDVTVSWACSHRVITGGCKRVCSLHQQQALAAVVY